MNLDMSLIIIYRERQDLVAQPYGEVGFRINLPALLVCPVTKDVSSDLSVMVLILVQPGMMILNQTDLELGYIGKTAHLRTLLKRFDLLCWNLNICNPNLQAEPNFSIL